MTLVNAEQIRSRCAAASYVADDALAFTLSLTLELNRPLLVEGEAGVGKTSIASVLSRSLERPLIRLQCYEGLDANAALYEWNYTHQLLSIKLSEASQGDAPDIFTEAYLLERPLLKAIRSTEPCVLLIDEIDRADEAFEAFLLELLSEQQISIPELGTLTARTTPLVVLTSNGTRTLSDALRRRCLYHYLDYPSPDKELDILRTHLPDVNEALSNQVVDFVQRLRTQQLRKPPGVAETLDWIRALSGMNISSIETDPQIVFNTRACLLKTHDDMVEIDVERIDNLLSEA
ncbi:MAG: ATPase [Thiotrichales bacterium]|nr:ATPase [Thiotrichales bacterium]